MRTRSMRRRARPRISKPVTSILTCLLLLAAPAVSRAGVLCSCDTDNDGVVDSLDNCLLVPNAGAAFCDTDQDGYGNACDSDLNNDGQTAGVDFTLFGQNFGSTGSPNIAGGNCDNNVLGLDFTFFGQNFGKPPGPSGLSCAGTIPCN